MSGFRGVRTLLAELALAALLAACADREPAETAVAPPALARRAAGTRSVEAAECARCHPHETEEWSKSPHARHAVPRAEPPSGADAAVGSRWMQAYLKRDELGLHRIVPLCFDLRAEEWRDVDDVLREISGEPSGLTPGARIPLERRSFDADCSGCHASGTDLRFDGTGPRAATTWRSLSIDCEACHGTAGEHGEGRAGDVVRLQELSPRARTMVCGRCHGGPPTDGDLPPSEAERFVTVLEDRPGHFPDGTAAGQSYQVGAFVRSPCFLQGGLSCTDCHAAHGPGLRGGPAAEGVCLSCHAGKNDRSHTHHDPAGEGARCIECHMPRLLGGLLVHQRDHRIGNPVPEIADAPDACSACHRDQERGWVESAWRRWYGEPPSATLEATAAIVRARRGDPGAAESLRRALRHSDPLFRAAAALYLRDGASLVDDPVPEVRLAAARASRGPESSGTLERLLQDAEPRIRGEAALLLSSGGKTLPAGALGDVAFVARHVRHAADPRRLLADAALRAGQTADALRWLEQVLAASPDEPRPWFEVADAHLRSGGIETFRGCVRRGVEAAIAGDRRGSAAATQLEEATSQALARHRAALASEIAAQAAERLPDAAARARFAAMSERLRR